MPSASALSSPVLPASHLSPLNWALRALVYPMFLVSGAAGLIYEVTWSRQLLYTFGSGLYAVCAVLAAFMAGLALGAWLLGRRSDTIRRPLRAYAILEVLIGLCGLMLPVLLGKIYLIDAWAYARWGQDFTILTTSRFVLSLAAMIIPTTLMGATLPILTRFMVRDQDHLGLHVGWLYAINTMGAVCGAFLAGFFLIERFGLHQTQWIAAGMNFFAAAGAMMISLRTEWIEPSAAPAQPAATAGEKDTDPTPVPEPTAPPVETQKDIAVAGDQAADVWIVRWVFLTAFVTGIVSLASQVLWSRTIVFSFEYLKNTTYAFSAILTVFLTGLALGSAIIGPLIDHQRWPLRLYGILLTLLGVSLAISVKVSLSGAEGMKWFTPLDLETGELNWALAVANIMLQTIGVIGVPTLLMGMAFPVAARIVARMGRVGSDVGRLYSLNTIGAIVGSLAAGFVIVPLVGLTWGLLLLGTIDVVLGLVTIWLSPGGRQHVRIFAPFAALILLLVAWQLSGMKEGGLQPLTTPRDVMVFYKEGPLATVSVIENNVKERTIYVDGVGVAGTDPILQTDQKSLAHVPMMLLARPQSALSVGFGAGGASYSLMLHDRLNAVHTVEICKTVLEAAPTLKAANHLFFGEDMLPHEFGARDPKFEVVLDDARAYLQYTDKRYDFISTDCTDLRYKSNANLYDLQYFQACRDRLTPEGVVVVWMPLAGLSEDVFKIALRTFLRVFPQMGIFYMNNESTHYILLIGWQNEIRMDYRLFERTLGEADVRDDLAELRLDDPVKLLSCFITGGEKLAQYLGDGPINTENEPLIEFLSPKYGYGDKPMIDNLNHLMQVRVSPTEFMDLSTIPEPERERLARYEQALPYIIAGHAHYRNFEQEGIYAGLEAATLNYLRAAELAPEDLSVKQLLQFPLLSARMEQEPDTELWYLLFARVYMVQKDRFKLDTAYDALRKAVAILERKQQALAAAPPGLVGVEQQKQAVERDLATARQWLEEVRRQLER